MTKALLATYSVLGVASLATAIWAYDMYWLTSAERSAALRAVYAIDSMTSSDLSNSAYRQRETKTESLLANAHIALRTRRDRTVTVFLDAYFHSVQRARSDRGESNQDDRKFESNPGLDVLPLMARNLQKQADGEDHLAATLRQSLMDQLQ